MKKLIVAIGILGAAWLGGRAIWHSSRFQSWRADRQTSVLPPAEQLAVSIAAPIINTDEEPANRNTNTVVEAQPAAKNLAVPFTSQAPHANWDQDHEEFCEEASVLMVGRYYQRRGIDSKDDAEAALQRIKQWEIDHIGFYYDTTAAETAQVLAGVYGLNTTLKENPTIDDMKTAIAGGHLVIVPAAGRELGNPNFTAPGPVYHNLVIRGYTDSGQFITNDPGTRKGEQYVYKQSVVMNAIHDWVPQEPRTTPRNGDATGRKVIIIVSQPD